MTADPTSTAFVLYRRKKYKESFPLLSILADKGDINSLLAMAWIKEKGADGEIDTDHAIALYNRAVKLGSSDALYRLGRILEKLNDFNGALSVFKRGAEKGHIPCVSALGILLVKLSKDPEEERIAMELLKRAAEGGHFFAINKLLILEMEKSPNVLGILKLIPRLLANKIKYIIELRSDPYSERVL